MLYRFQIELSDIDRGVYESLDFRVAQHPSETGPYLLSRVIAYALSYQPGLEFSPAGLGDPEAPALRVTSGHGNVDLWIEIGHPSSRKLHKASKSAKQVEVYTYKNPQVLVDLMINDQVHHASQIPIRFLNASFLEGLEGQLEKNNRWSFLFQQGLLVVNTGRSEFSCEIHPVFAGR